MAKILIIEDESMLREVYTTLFSLEKYEVANASNGKDALKKIKEFKPDVVVLDLLMPVMNGIEFLQHAQMKINHPETKVLVLSNLSDPKTISKVLKLGVTDYKLKASLSPVQLVSAVKNLGR